MPDAYESCHEAGHGVVRVLNGDIVDSIVIHKPGKLPVGALPGERGVIKFHFKPMECECGGYVRCEGEDRPDALSFGKECPRCREYVRNMVTGMVAGDEATKRLRPAEYNPYDSQYDADSIDAVFSIYAVPSDERKAIEAEAHKRAAQLIEREEAAVRALQAVIESSSGRVERQEIEAVISRARTKPDCAVRAIPGAMRVLTIDLSGNVKDFEHEMSRQLHSFLRRNEIAVAHPEPLMPKTLREFGAIVELRGIR